MRYFPKIQFLHEETKQISVIPSNQELWPASWKKTDFKEYKRFPKIFLPSNFNIPNNTFSKVLSTRHSSQDFNLENKLSLNNISTLLKFSSGLKDNSERKFRFYPSAGARYPIEIYLAARDVEGLESGVYHHNVKEHALEKILEEDGEDQLKNQIREEWAKEAQLTIIISSIFERSMLKYRERGYRLALLEAGMVIQNFYLISSALDLGCCALGNVLDDKLDEILDLDPLEETTIGILVIGNEK